MDELYQLRLYVAGRAPASVRAIARLHMICEARLGSSYELEIVDVAEDPERADRDRVLATPTLIKEGPLPMRRVVGDMSDVEQVLYGLDILPSAPTVDASGPEANDLRHTGTALESPAE